MKSILNYKKVHMVGVKGTGMAALACMLSENEYSITGSDVTETFITTDGTLRGCNIMPCTFAKENVHGVDAIIKSNAYDKSNEEVKEAGVLNIPIFTYAEVVAEFFNAHYGIAVTGTHGKTTTSAILAHLLLSARKNVSAIVGSQVRNWESGAMVGDLTKKDALFVLEADEYKEAFLQYHPKIAIITNIDYDHPDYFANTESYIKAFEKFVASLPQDGFLVYNADDKISAFIARKIRCKRMSVRTSNGYSKALTMPGNHNNINAALAATVAGILGVGKKDIISALSTFKGIARRFEYIGTSNNALIFDDFAHHPTEIKATLSTARNIYPNKKIIVVFQPHTYSRTEKFFDDFCISFSDIDMLIMTDIYASAREQQGNNTDIIKHAVKEIEQNGITALYINKESVAPYLKEKINEQTVVITMGAGDIWEVSRELISL